MEQIRFKFFDKFYNSLNDTLYSIMELEFSHNELTPANLLNNKKHENRYVPILIDSKYGKEIYHLEGIFKHVSGFYIYLSRLENESEFKIRVIYNVEQYEQIKIYINSLKKIK